MDKELKALLIELEKDILRSMDGKITQEVKQVYSEEVDNMYREYTPNYYERRYNDKGFGDDSLWDVDVNLTNNGVDLTLINEADAVNSNVRLDTLIEEGLYDWKNSPNERPVYERTQNRLDSEQIIENILESELRKKGWELK